MGDFCGQTVSKSALTELFSHCAWRLGGVHGEYLKAEAGMQANHIMLASAAKFVGALGTHLFLKTRLDRWEPAGDFVRPHHGLVCVGVFGLIAGKVVPLNFTRWPGHLSFGFVLSSVTMSMTRLRWPPPRLGGSHYFAVYAVVATAMPSPTLGRDDRRAVSQHRLAVEWIVHSLPRVALVLR